MDSFAAAEHVTPGSRVLDVGCGQGTQAIALAVRGCDVRGVDPSPALLSLLTEGASAAGVRIRTAVGRAESLGEVVDSQTFDVVCAHGLMMFFDDRFELLRLLGERLVPGGILSLTSATVRRWGSGPGCDRTGRALSMPSALTPTPMSSVSWRAQTGWRM